MEFPSVNRLLKRQIKRYLGGTDNVPESMYAFLEAVNRSYIHYEEDRRLLERSMDISSTEIREMNEQLTKEVAKQNTVLNKLKSSLKTLFSLELGFQNINIEDDEDILTIIELVELQSNKIKQVEEELILVQSFINQSNDAIQVADAEGHTVFINEKAEHLLEASKEEVYGKKIYDFDNKFRNAASWSKLVEGLKTHQSLLLERNQIFKDGTSIPVESNVKTIEVNGQEYLVGVSRDITERKSAEKKTQELILHLQQANLELENFAYIVSHDLKAPLRGIGSLTDFLMMDLEDIVEEDTKEMLVLLKNRVKKMNALINGILEYSRIGNVVSEQKDINLAELVVEVIDFLAPPTHFDITVTTSLPIVHNNETRIQQVFQNLISNAIKYNDKEKGIITISHEDIGGHWEFCVADNGQGIDPKYHDKIFQIFETLEKKKNDSDSTGVGLTIVKKIVEMSEGTMRLESEVNAGTKFYFTLPKKETNS